MFQFPEFASYTYVFSAWYPTYVGWVSPFRHLWIKVCLPTPQSFSQAPTSFIASNCQGIHRMRLVAWPYMINRYCAQSSTLLCTFTFIAVLIEYCYSSFDFAINMKFISPDLYAWFESLRYSFLNFFSFNYYLVKELGIKTNSKRTIQMHFQLISTESDRFKRWWSYAGSNRRPPACKAGALPAEL